MDPEGSMMFVTCWQQGLPGLFQSQKPTKPRAEVLKTHCKKHWSCRTRSAHRAPGERQAEWRPGASRTHTCSRSYSCRVILRRGPQPSTKTKHRYFIFLSKNQKEQNQRRSCQTLELPPVIGTAGPHPQGTHLTTRVSEFSSSKLWTRNSSPEKELVLALSQQ